MESLNIIQSKNKGSKVLTVQQDFPLNPIKNIKSELSPKTKFFYNLILFLL